MPNLDELDQKVSELVRDESPAFEFRFAFKDIEEATKTGTNAQVPQLTAILSSFRARVPSLIILKPIRARAKDLADTLMLSSLEERISRINARNEALASLTGKLEVQIDKANSDAGLLARIKDGVEKATKTINELRALVDELNATDASTKDQLLALIESLGNISSIFEPEEE